MDYQTYQTIATGMQTTWSGTTDTDPTSLPISGSSTFAGVIDLMVETGSGELGMAGALALTANFSANSISGTATGFMDENANGLAGVLAISSGAINRGANTAIQYTYSALLGGTLTGGGETYGISADFDGDFLGIDNLATTGAITGTATSGFGTGYLFGSFIAEQ
ncbi:MAG: hypothetical protein V3V25_04215 [Paracoccaceae bacterium]